MNIFNCPRCGEQKLEIMKSYCFCWECGYSPNDGESPFLQSTTTHKFLHKDPIEQNHKKIMERAS